MFKSILVPLDGSHLAEAALKTAKEMASKFGGEITLLQACSSPYLVTGMSGKAYADLMVNMRQQALDEAKAYLNSLNVRLRKQGYVIHSQITTGKSPAEEILDVAEAQQMDVIVMSTHGRGGVSRWVFGSVADKVLRHAKIPVLLIRPDEQSLDLQVSEIEDLESMPV